MGVKLKSKKFVLATFFLFLVSIGIGSTINANKLFSKNRFTAVDTAVDFLPVIVNHQITLDQTNISFSNVINRIVDGDDSDFRKDKVLRFVKKILKSYKEAPGSNVHFPKIAELDPCVLISNLDREKFKYCQKYDDLGLGLHVTAVVNRFDLAPADYSDCGEYRIVFSTRRTSQSNDVIKRFFLIFEFKPKPSPDDANDSKKFCEKFAKSWLPLACLSNDTKKLAEYIDTLFLGESGVLALSEFKNGLGQIRGNALAKPNVGKINVWVMRQWNLKQNGGSLMPEAAPLASSPFAYLFEDIASAGNKKIKADKNGFRKKFRKFALKGLRDPGFTVLQEDKNENWLIFRLGSVNLCEDPSKWVDCNKFFTKQQITNTKLADRVNLQKTSQFKKGLLAAGTSDSFNKWKISSSHYFRRAMAVSCGGCHSTNLWSGNEDDREIGLYDGESKKWVEQTDFVHVSEPASCDSRKSMQDCFIQKTSSMLKFNLLGNRLKLLKNDFPEPTESDLSNKLREVRQNIAEQKSNWNSSSLEKSDQKLNALLNLNKSISTNLNGAFHLNRRSH